MDKIFDDGRKHGVAIRSMARKRKAHTVTSTRRKRRKISHSHSIESKEPENSSDSSILCLPNEIIEKILGMISSFKEIGKLRGVCSTFDNACSNILRSGFKMTEKYVATSVGGVNNQFLSDERTWLLVCMAAVRSAISGHVSVMGLPVNAGGLLDSYLRYLKRGYYVTTRECRIMTKKFLTNFYRIADKRLEMWGASRSLRRYVDVAGLLRLLKTCVNAREIIAYTNEKVAIYEFLLEGCWMSIRTGLGRGENFISYPEEVGHLYYSLSALVCASNASRSFRTIEEWPVRDQLVVFGCDTGPPRKTKPTLTLRIQIEGPAVLLQSLSEHVQAEISPPDRADLLMHRDSNESEELFANVHLETHAGKWCLKKSYVKATRVLRKRS